MEFKQIKPNYHVDWPARTLSQDRTLTETTILNAAANYLIISFPKQLPKGEIINIEFYCTTNKQKHRIRAVTKVEACQIGRKNILLQLRISKADRTEIHAFNNALMELEDLRRQRMR